MINSVGKKKADETESPTSSYYVRKGKKDKGKRLKDQAFDKYNGKKGHKSDQPYYKQGKGKSDSATSSSKSQLGKGQVTCYQCGGIGHTRKSCPSSKVYLNDNPEQPKEAIPSYCVFLSSDEGSMSKTFSCDAIIDTGSVSNIVGYDWVNKFSEKHGPESVLWNRCVPKAFKFGNGKEQTAGWTVTLKVKVGKPIHLTFYALEDAIPALVGADCLKRMRAFISVCDSTMCLLDIGVTVPLKTSSSGHILLDLQSEEVDADL